MRSLSYLPYAPVRPDESPALTRFQRMLLGIDGTVTHVLEAYADEPVEVVKLLQVRERSMDGHPDLDLSVGDPVLRRQVVLRGRHSRRNLLYAEATIVLGRVEPAFLDDLSETDKPLGTLLAEHRTETFRENLHVDREVAGPVGAHFGIDASAQLICRTYRIFRAGRPIILISEKFPPALFRSMPL